MIANATHPFESVNQAFSRQSASFDAEDYSNPVLQKLRLEVYEHVNRFIKPDSRILELNAGTGIDAVYFVSKGHSVYATDLSDGMVEQLRLKRQRLNLTRLQIQQLSYDQLNQLRESEFDFVFSNFGGLNCIDDLSRVTKSLPDLLTPGAFVTWVIMPPICMWEIASIFKGNKNALRRFQKEGVMAHLEGHYFRTYYHSVHSAQTAFGKRFTLVAAQGLAVISPPPYAFQFVKNYPTLTKTMQAIENALKTKFPFNRCGDHVIVTFRFNG